MTETRVPLFVRLPQQQARELDRLVTVTGRRKQQLVSELLSGPLTVGRADVAEAVAPEVLTLAELAQLLRLPVDDLAARAAAGELPGRRVGAEWRFSRAAVLAWLAGGDAPRSGRCG